MSVRARQEENVMKKLENLGKKFEEHLKAFKDLYQVNKQSPDVDQPHPNFVPKLQLPNLILEPFPSKDDYLKEDSAKNQFSHCALDVEKAELDAVNRTVSSMKLKHVELQKDNEKLKKRHNEVNKQHKHMRETLADVDKNLKGLAIPNYEVTKRNLINLEKRLDKIRSHAPVISGLNEKLITLHQQALHMQSLVSEKEETIKIFDIQRASHLCKTRKFENESRKAQENLKDVKSALRSSVLVTGKDLWSSLDDACDACSNLVENMKNGSSETREDGGSPVEETPQLPSSDVEMISENIFEM